MTAFAFKRYNDTLQKTASLLARQSVKVTSQGARAFITYNHVGKIQRINVPVIPEDADEAFMEVIAGYLDHEVGHALNTNPVRGREVEDRFIRDHGINEKKMRMMSNIIEDVRIEACMEEEFRGCGRNLDATRVFFMDRISREYLSKIPEENHQARRAVAMVPYFRARGGQVVAQRFMDDHDLWGAFEAYDRAMPDLAARLEAMQTTEDAAELAGEIMMLFPKAEAENSDPDEMEDEPEPEEPEDDSEDDADDKDKGESDDDADKSDEDEEGDGSKSDDDDDEGDTKDEDKGDTDEEDEEGGSSDGDGDGDSEDEEEGDADSEDTDEDEDAEDGDGSKDGDEDGDEEGDTDGEDSHEEIDSDEEGEEEEDYGDEGDEADGDGDPLDSDDGNEASDGNEGGEDDGDEEDAEADHDVGYDGEDGLTNDQFDFDADDFKDFDDAMGDEIESIVSTLGTGDLYRVFTYDNDLIARPNAPEGAPVARYEERVADTTYALRKEMERMVAARSMVTQVPGYRRGRIHAASLHRIMTHDDRVFSRKHENQSKDTAISLVVDMSGSMAGQPVQTALEAAWAFADVLTRIKVNCEVIGFTTRRRGYRVDSDELARFQRLVGRYTPIRIEALHMPILKEFGEPFGLEQKRRIAGAESTVPLIQNIDGECIRVAASRLIQQKESRKIMIVFSDGSPAAGFGLHVLGQDLSKSVREITEAGIETIGIGIEDDNVLRYYPRAFVINDVNELGGAMLQELKRLMIG